MAKAPSAKVAATSGQGVSRLAYQKAYALGKGASVPGERNPKATLSSSRNDYAKTKLDKPPQGKVAAPEAEQYQPPKSAVSLAQAKPKKLELPKEDSGFLKGKR